MTKRSAQLDAAELLAAPFMKSFGGSMTNAVAMGEAYAKACLELQEEWLRFVGARLRNGTEVQKCLADCGNVSEVAKIQQDWFAAASRDYLEEAGRLMQITTRAAQNGFSCLQSTGKVAPPA